MSRYSFRDFWHISKLCIISVRSSTRPSSLHARTTFVSRTASFCRSLNCWSIASNRFVSSGNCLLISADPKNMASSPAHCFVTELHCFRHISTLPKTVCHPETLFLKNATNFPIPIIVCNSIWWASNSSMISSDILITDTSLSLNWTKSSANPAQVCSIIFNFLSIFSSFDAVSTTSRTSSS